MSESAAVFPTLSVVIPTWNRAAFIADAIASVRAQGHPSLELIVVDDGSTDETAEIVRARGDVDVFLQQANAGPSAARNAGIRRARGEWIGFLDSDDLWTPDALQLHAQAVAEQGAKPIVLGESRFEGLDGSAADIAWMPSDELPATGVSPERYRYLRQCHLGSAVFARAVFDRIGLLDESLRFREDREFFKRAETANLVLLQHEGMVQIRRSHGGNMTRDTDQMMDAAPRFLKRVLELRRRGLNPGA